MVKEMMTRRKLFKLFGGSICGTLLSRTLMATQQTPSRSVAGQSKDHSNGLTLFLCGDVMTGRGIDQLLPNPGSPVIYESYLRNAKDYIRLVSGVNNPIVTPVGYDYIWGDGLLELAHRTPDVRLINLETSITTSDDYWPGKGINYRMHPGNIAALTVAGIDCCSLANNHVLDWGYTGLEETLLTLQESNLKVVGVGQDLIQAITPQVIEVGQRNRIIVIGLCSRSSGVPGAWAAKTDQTGVYLIDEQDLSWIYSLKERITKIRQAGDILVCSIHWGGNWGYTVPDYRQYLAHQLIDLVGADVVHGHSSHHAMAIEVYRDKLILYGCGDFINDYEGIGNHQEFRDDLRIMYFVNLDTSGKLSQLELIPLQSKQFRLVYAQPADTQWLQKTLQQEGKKLGTRLEAIGAHQLTLRW